MTKRRFHLWALSMAIAGATLFTACEKETPKPTPDPIAGNHFDIWVSLTGQQSGMGSVGDQLIVLSTPSLDDKQTFNFKDAGADATATLYRESIIRGKYYYQVPKTKDRIGKYRIAGKTIETVAEVPFAKNTLKDRRYTHAWVDDRTLVLIAANGEADKVIWIKLQTDPMKIVAEGELELPAPPDKFKFNTSGIANYRDGKILYAFIYNSESSKFNYATRPTAVNVAFIDAASMKVEKVVKDDRAETLSGTAFGELLQQKTFFTENGDYYIACARYPEGAKSNTQQYGALLRIKKGETDFDRTYRGYNYTQGKIVTAEYMGNNKVLLYIQDPTHTGSDWGAGFNSYYAIFDIATDKLDEIKYNGQRLPFSSGTFSQRSAIVDGKAYIGVNPKEGDPAIYIYDLKTGSVSRGATIAKGFEFDRIVVLKD